MDTSVIIIGLLAGIAIVMAAYFQLSKKPKLKPLVVGAGGPVRSDDDVMVRHQPVIVNILFETGQSINQGLLADLVVNYKDLISGKYKAPVRYLEKQEVLSVKDEPMGSYAKGTSLKEIKEQPETEDEEEVDLSGQPENLPDPGEGDIPDFKPVDVSSTNFNF